MSELAFHGGAPEVKGPLKRYNSFGTLEQCAMEDVAFDARLGAGLSSYLAGHLRGGARVRTLEAEWAVHFNAKHAIACNSATSGLLAACVAAELGPGDLFITTPYTMSATVAPAVFLGAAPIFGDIEDRTFCLDWLSLSCKAIIVTNLFGHPANVRDWTKVANEQNAVLIEDNSHAPFATQHGRYTGTIGDIGVFSLNVHKHLQCGEGGMIVTNDDTYAERMRLFINHGEMGGRSVGLNLRMTEVCAAVASVQLGRALALISSRIAIAEHLTKAAAGIAFLTPPTVGPGCRHVYYCWAAQIAHHRDWFVNAMLAEGVPMRAGYTNMLYALPAFKRFASECPVAEKVEQQMALFEVCAFDPTPEQLVQIGNAFHKVAEQMP